MHHHQQTLASRKKRDNLRGTALFGDGV